MTSTVVLLRDPPGERVLLLQRAACKAFAPGRLTGVGGGAEPGEAPEAAAWCELAEETGLGPADVTQWRPWAVVACPEKGVELFDCGARAVRAPDPPACRAGVLGWVARGDLPCEDVIGNTAAVLAWVLAQAAPPAEPRQGLYRDGMRTWC